MMNASKQQNQMTNPCADPDKYVRRLFVVLGFFFQFLKGERIQIPLKAHHHRPARETPFKGVSLASQ